MTRICVFGAGAIGGFLAVALARAGAEVSVIARGPHLAAIKKNGLRLIKDATSETVRVKASSCPADLGKQDYVIISLKAHSVPPIVEQFAPLLDDKTAIVSAVNGIPWWYFHKAGTETALEEKWVEAVDPAGAQWKFFGPERAIGCVVYPACEISEPGIVEHKSGVRFSLGEPDGERSARVLELSALMQAGGLRAPVRKRLRDEIWLKLWGNCSFNPISALTGASLDQIGSDPASRALVHDIMQECKNVGEAIGARFNVSIERRIDGAAAIVGHKPSTRQDIELGRPLELDALVCSVLELARKLEITTPALDALAALSRLQGEVLGLYSRRAQLEALIAPVK
ncbi:2-dehydropantoate 2-reductase [hydrothermal vent metagenome]|uniref:2-dehydropantoate 2-reductase n=1 Tax=hydrothermal vent metagenome TaxID=652676 RepID=A0A3B0TZY3_9ZZZZ